MIVSAQHLQESLSTKSFGPIGFGHGQLKYSAEIAASLYGCEWAYKNPSSLESNKLRQRLRDLVLSNTPTGHSNKDIGHDSRREGSPVLKRISIYFARSCSRYSALLLP